MDRSQYQEADDNLIVVTLGETPVTKKMLADAFDLVKPAENWKGEIDKIVVSADAGIVNVIMLAIEFFTGSAPAFDHVASIPRFAGPTKIERIDHVWRFRADGYYKAVGA